MWKDASQKQIPTCLDKSLETRTEFKDFVTLTKTSHFDLT
jgi:hypothetical protein